MPEGNTPAPAGSSKKKWYIIGGIIVVLVLMWMGMRSVPALMLAREGVRMEGTPDGAMTYSDDQGNKVTVGGTSMPSNWPSDAPQNYAGANITYSGSSDPQTGQPGAAVSYTVHASVQQVADYYKQQLESAGWTIVSTTNVGGATILSATKDARGVGVYIVDDGSNGVTVTVGLGNQ